MINLWKLNLLHLYDDDAILARLHSWGISLLSPATFFQLPQQQYLPSLVALRHPCCSAFSLPHRTAPPRRIGAAMPFFSSVARADSGHRCEQIRGARARLRRRRLDLPVEGVWRGLPSPADDALTWEGGRE
jgi:hypothetical protein